MPVLHRPTLERAIKEGRHKREEDYANVVLLVCALGARWCTDRTVLLGVGDDEGRLTAQERKNRGVVEMQDVGPDSIQDDFWREGEDDEEWHSAGWKWFKQVRFGRKALYGPPNVLDLQIACVSLLSLSEASCVTVLIFLVTASVDVLTRLVQPGSVSLDHRRGFAFGPRHGCA